MKVKNEQKSLKSDKGITLIALVITIVVMLILAGVTINLTLGENGIFTTAQQAAKNYTEAQNKEQEDLAYFTNTVNNIIEGKKTLTSQITGADYGKSINYSVTVKNRSNEDVTLNNWRIFYNDKITGNVYIILDGYLPSELVPEETGMTQAGTYQVCWDTTNFATTEETVATLRNTLYWSIFARGIEGATAIGSPTNDMFVNSWNENSVVNSTKLTYEKRASNLTDSSNLYIPYTEVIEGCYGYWLATSSGAMWLVECGGNMSYDTFRNSGFCIRPVVCLPFGIGGTVGNSVSIDK